MGGEVLENDGSMTVKFIISQHPTNLSVAERAIPSAIFEAEVAIKEKFLKKWLKDSQLKNFDIRSILDWDYYKERLGGSI